MRLIAALLLIVVTLTACGGSEQAEEVITSDLPLAADEPTLLLFYTDN